jgi:hypothetical protein
MPKYANVCPLAACGPSVTPSEWWESQIPFLIEELQDGGIQEDDEAEQGELVLVL